LKKSEYVQSFFIQKDPIHQLIFQGLTERGIPQISVSSEAAKILYLLIKMTGAKKILEIGTLGGYSTIWLARALCTTGKVLSLEISQHHADFAQENIEKAGLSDQVDIMVGDAMESLEILIAKNEKFDFFFIDADKPNYPTYLEKVIKLSKPGSVIAADNLFLEGDIFDLDNQAPSSIAIRNFNNRISQDPRLESIILTIGDGLGVCRVKEV
jgi:predicted O-methyltransferase YrrM